MEKVAIAILNWNGKDFLQRFLPSVINHSKIEGVKIYIIDNGSNDGSIELLAENFKEIGVIQLGYNWRKTEQFT